MAAWNETKTYKTFMAKLYGIGAAVVIAGALFKIMHWPYSGPMLIAGMGTEVVIFFFSAFEPIHSEPDWSLVYPELAGMDDHDHRSMKDKKKSLASELDKMLEEAKIGPELMRSLGEGMQHLSENANKLSGISDAAAATDGYVSNLSKASSSVSELSNTYDKTTEALRKDMGTTEVFSSSLHNASDQASELAQSYSKMSDIMKSDVQANEAYLSSVQMATQSAQELVQNYVKSSESLTRSAEAIDFSMVDGNAYATELQKISKNLSALNSVYEIQLKESNEQVQSTGTLKTSIDDFVENLRASIEDTRKFNDGVTQLNQNIAALNTIYGNMLTAMSMGANR
ncbi:MAG: gliding motility protein GldL [Bacteroidota bacterium]